MNMITHIVGGGMGVIVLVLCLSRSIRNHYLFGAIGSAIYGVCMITLYTMSSVYHGMKPGTGKKVMQVVDHCTIYFLIAGSYTVVVLSALRPEFPEIAWGLFCFVWALTMLAVVLTAIDLKKYNAFSMVCYICMGWAVLPFLSQARQVLTDAGFLWLLLGGISYTVGAVRYGLGVKKRWMHSVFHIFVVLGSLLQFLCILFYAI